MESIDDNFENMEDNFDDAFEEEENQRMTLRFVDAVTGEPVEDAKVAVMDNDYETNYHGKVRFDVNEHDVYACFIHDYSNRNQDNSRSLAKSGASVRIYVGDRLLKTINIKEGRRGNLWKVFTY
ncbi:MAG: hypothetical protein ACP5DZ_00005 [Bacteroidales bacterium]